MKVALLGAPGAGKTKFARKLASAMGKDVGQNRPAIIDGYIEKLEDKTGFKLDYGATYPQNYQIIFHRWTLEQEAKHKGLDTITCGTIYETFIYVVLFSNLMEEVKRDNIEESLQARAAATGLGMIETLTYDYEALFYLPYDGATVAAKGSSYDIVLDRKIPEVLQAYFKNFVTLDKSERENVRYAHQLITGIREAQEHEATEDDELAVRGSRELASEEPIPE